MKMWRILFILYFILFQTTYLLAGPGGKIAKEIFESPAAKIIGILLAIVLLPIIIRYYYKKYKATRRTKQLLDQLSQINHNLFDQLSLKNRMTDIFTRVHTAWSNQNMEECSEFMSAWYQQNQQTVYLDEWKKKGLINICTIKEVKNIVPIHIRLTNDPDFEGTRIVYSITAEMEDYLVKEDNSAIIEGKKGFNNVETVWTIVLIDGSWKVDNIEQSDMISNYLKMKDLAIHPSLERLRKKSA